jgi:hypothetical protein
MQLATAHRASGNVSRLQRRAFGRRMRRQITGDRNQDAPALVGVAPNGELSDPRFQHLVGMEARVLAGHCQRESAISRCGEWPRLKCRATSLAA